MLMRDILRSTTQLLPLAVLLSACGEQPMSPEKDRDQPQHATQNSPILTKADLCRMLLSGEQLDTQTLLDLSYEINPTRSNPYEGPDTECHGAALRELSQRK